MRVENKKLRPVSDPPNVNSSKSEYSHLLSRPVEKPIHHAKEEKNTQEVDS